MKSQITPSQAAERLLYLLAVILAPNIPLFFLYNKNAAQGILFSHCLIFGGVLAALSLFIYLLVSTFALRRRRTLIVVTLFWAAFWFFQPLHTLVAKGDAAYPMWKTVLWALAVIAAAGFILRRLKMSPLATQTIAVMLCLLFVFNFGPGALAVAASEKQRAENERNDTRPYEIKTEFNVDPDLPHPNIYWLHMDGMVGFDAVERYFGDPQTELKQALNDRGFLINESARLEGGSTDIAVVSLMSPAFYDSYFVDEFVRVAQFSRMQKHNSLQGAMAEKGFSLVDDIYPKIEALKAFFEAGYVNIGYGAYMDRSENIDIWDDGKNITIGIQDIRIADMDFNKINDFKNLIVGASALTIAKSTLDAHFERTRPVGTTQPIPAYQEAVDYYVTGDSDSDGGMIDVIRAMKYATNVESSHFFYFTNYIVHGIVFGRTIGETTYDEPVGTTFSLDEDGNYYDEPLEDPLDLRLYHPQHKYGVQQMMAQVDVILENDPDAVIVIQADHGIHVYGRPGFVYDPEEMARRGYDLEDQQNLQLQVISAVRIPPQYGTLTAPLDPLDIARYLVNHYVGQNYDYLYYQEEEQAK
jgi:hypothetical protein